MNMYRTFGTIDYLSRLKAKHPKESMLLLAGDEGQAVLLHESEYESFFTNGTEYEVIHGSGALTNSGFAVMNNIPVNEDGRPLFEYRFKHSTGQIETNPGFRAIRVLRPRRENTYVILSLWGSEEDFLNWKNSEAYKEVTKKSGTSFEASDNQSLFPGPSFVTKYIVIE